ncbi:hypothetical protein HK405_008018, partial [Cladochytrium tenue]
MSATAVFASTNTASPAVDPKSVGVGVVGASPASCVLNDPAGVRDRSRSGDDNGDGWITLVGTSVETARTAATGSGAAFEPLAVEEEPGAGHEAFDSYPDGGHEAWTVVAASFALFMTTLGGIYSWGVFQDRLVADGLAPSSTLVWIGSAQASVESLLIIPGDRLVAAYGPRRVALVGTFFAAAGPILAGFCTNSVVGLILTEGLMFGLGQALCFYAVATLPATYFLRRRNLATGIVFSGAGVGGAVFSIVTAQLLRSLSLAWTFRAIGLIFLALNLPAALALRSRAPAEPMRRSSRRMLD